MKYTVQELALQYAEKLVAFHEAKNSDQEDRSHVLRAYEEWCHAQAALDTACERAAKLLA
jgi:hypothetical protein